MAVRVAQRAVVAGVARVDAALDGVLYRPAVVRATLAFPRWWRCDLAKLSMWLDDRWQVGWWGDEGRPGGECAVCARRPSIFEYGGECSQDAECLDCPEPADDILHRDSIAVCGWCTLEGQILTGEDLDEALRAARSRSVAWRWR
jgi:hypothetical protein